MHNYEGLDGRGGFSRAHLLAPLKDRDFRLLWTGLFVSLLGDGIFLIAVAWQAYELSNLPVALSLVFLSMTVTHVFFLMLGGVVSDRFERRKVMLAADVVRGLALAGMAALSLTSTLSLVSLAALTAVYGAGTAFFGPAFDAIVPDIVPPRLLRQANSLDQLIKPLGLRLFGPALGGLLVGAWGPGAAFAVDAATFAASAGALMMMSHRAIPSTGSAKSFMSELRSGYSFVRKHVWLWGTFSAAAVAYLLFMGPAEVLLPYIVKVEMKGSAGDLGLIFAIGGVGSILSAIVVSTGHMQRRNVTFIYMTWTLSTLAIAGYGLARFPWQLMVASFAFNFLESAGTIVWVTTKQRMIPSVLLGRVSSIDWLISIGLVPLSYAATGPISSVLGARTTLVGAGVLGAAVTMGAFFLPGMRDMEHVDVEPAGSVDKAAIAQLKAS
ncbi:MAG: MFS transporter [Actinomycetota bacterium]|nr:MFS transporter [Actinomycetota bacterium]